MLALFQHLNDNPAFLFISTFIFGLLVGSFLNVVIYRLPKMLEQDWAVQCAHFLDQPEPEQEKITLSTPNSTCPKCGHAIKPWENIPVISYIFLQGRCSQCKNKISIRYPLVELATALLSLAAISVFGASYAGFAAVVLTWVLVALTMIDYDTQLLPDNITLPLMWGGLILNYYETFIPLSSALWGAIFGYLSLWLVFHVFKLLTGKEGMGYGDFKLLAALGAWFGWQALPVIILLSSVVGAAIGIGLILIKGRDKNIPIPFGPYLAIAGWVYMIYGDLLLQLWLGSAQA